MQKFDRYDTVLVPWYSEGDFPALRALAGNDPGLPRTYAEWKHQSAIATEILLAKGKTVQIMTVRPGDYVDWLRNSHRSNTASARLRYLKWLATQSGKKATILPLPARLLPDLDTDG